MWLAYGGVRGGMTHGETDVFAFKAMKDRIHIHDLHAVILHLVGSDYEKLTDRFGGKDFRLTDVRGHVLPEISA